MKHYLSRFLSTLVFIHLTSATYDVGSGIADITGPETGVVFMGYSKPQQVGSGIHIRLFSRAFVFQDSSANLIAFVSVDGGMGSDVVKSHVINQFNLKLGRAILSNENLCISGTHTHSGPGGFSQYVLYQTSTYGFVNETFTAWVDGITTSLISAYQRMEPSTVTLAVGSLLDANINRSPTSYLLNPLKERDMYPEGDTDKRMTLLRVETVATRTKPAVTTGVVNWFAVHGTSMNNTNTLVSGDNKGFASYILEKHLNAHNQNMVLSQATIAAFASTNLGDVSPNTQGPICIDTGLPCDGSTSSCNGKCENCIASGPGEDMFESTRIIGQKQAAYAMKLLEMLDHREMNGTSAVRRQALTGPVDYRHSFVRFSGLMVTLADGSTTTLCRAAFGYSFAAGTTDGPGAFSFTQGTTTGNPFWNSVRDLLSKPSLEEIKCQRPKPILLNLGDMIKPYPWVPDLMPLQILRIGNLYLLCAPVEFTTMAGRRLRAAISEQILKSTFSDGISSDDVHVVIAGLANSYLSYVTTFEEYQAQRYEAASTLYGPHELDGLIQEFTRLMNNMIEGTPSATEEPPEDLLAVQLAYAREPKYDALTPHSSIMFGDVIPGYDAELSYRVGSTVSVTFQGSNPRHSRGERDTLLKVKRLCNISQSNLSNKFVSGYMLAQSRVRTQCTADMKFVTVAIDSDWETKFHWLTNDTDSSNTHEHIPRRGLTRRKEAVVSYVRVEWSIPKGAEAGAYCVCYEGDAKLTEQGATVPFSGCSSVFRVIF